MVVFCERVNHLHRFFSAVSAFLDAQFFMRGHVLWNVECSELFWEQEVRASQVLRDFGWKQEV